MLVLVRKDNKVYHNNVELRINAQLSKGKGKEVVDIAGLPNSNNQKWVSLSRLKQGHNEIECKGRIVSKTTQKYVLTQEESKLVKSHQDAIDKIIEVAKSRYISKPNLNIDVNKLTKEEKLEHQKQVEEYLRLLKS